MSTTSDSFQFVLTKFQPDGCALSPDALYLKRQADANLRAALLRGGSLAYVIGPTQMGKSSLCLNTVRHLEKHGVRAAWIDIGLLRDAHNEHHWFELLVDRLIAELGLPADFKSLTWPRYSQQPAGLCWNSMFRAIIASYFENYPPQPKSDTAHLAILFDEIDSVRAHSLDLDSFFTVIRSCVEDSRRRASSPYHKVSICFVGRRTPHQLLHDTSITSLALGQGIELQDFVKEEVQDFRAELYKVTRSDIAFNRAFEVTEGHPFMLNRICNDIYIERCQSQEDVDKIISAVFAKDDYQTIGMFKAVEDRILVHHRRSELFEIYYKLLFDPRPIPKKRKDELQIELVQSGLCCWRNHELQPRNQIYKNVFDAAWLRSHRGGPRPLDARIEPWLKANRSDEHLLNQYELQAEENRFATGEYEPTEIEREFLSASETYASAFRLRRTKLFAAVSAAVIIVAIVVAFFLLQSRSLRAEIVFYQDRIKNQQQVIRELEEDSRRLRESLQKSHSQLDDQRRAYDELSLKYIKLIDDRNRLVTELNTAMGLIRLREVALEEMRTKYQDMQNRLGKLSKDAENLQQLLTESRQRIARLEQKEATATDVLLEKPTFAFRHERPVRSVALSADIKSVYTADGEGNIFIWSPSQEDSPVAQLKQHSGAINDLALSNDGALLVSGDTVGVAQLWDIRKRTVSATLRGHSGSISAVAIAPDGKYVATASSDSTIRIWDAQKGTPLRILSGHKGEVTAIAFARDGIRLVSGARDRTVRIYSLANGHEQIRLRERFDSEPTFVAFSPNARAVLIGTYRGSTSLYYLHENRALRADILGKQPVGTLVAGLFARQQSFTATIDVEGVVCIYEAFTGIRLRRLSPALRPLGGNVGSRASTKVANDAVFSEDGKWVVTASDDGLARMWRVNLE